MPDIAIPIVFPDYLIAVATPRSLKVPDLLPGIDLLPDELKVPSYKRKVPELGHAGILFIDGRSGTTKYYEYGRYDSEGLGRVQKHSLRDLNLSSTGRPTHSELAYVLSQISAKAGQSGRISAAYIAAPNCYEPMLSYAKKRVADNNNPARQRYDILRNSCNHFMKQMLEIGGIRTPSMVDPRPNSYIKELRRVYPTLDYMRVGHSLLIHGLDQQLAGRANHEQPAAA